jgi:hypothetical protein
MEVTREAAELPGAEVYTEDDDLRFNPLLDSSTYKKMLEMRPKLMWR